MVLGDGTAALAPAHRISPSTPGTAWVIEEDGSADRVRADFWSDDLVRDVATLHPAPYIPDATAPVEPVESVDDTAADLGTPVEVEPGGLTSVRSRKPRPPRQPRTPRRPRASAPSVASPVDAGTGPEAA